MEEREVSSPAILGVLIMNGVVCSCCLFLSPSICVSLFLCLCVCVCVCVYVAITYESVQHHLVHFIYLKINFNKKTFVTEQ